MSSCIAKIQTSVALQPDLLTRVDRIAAADARSRSYVVAQALTAFCDANERPNTSSAVDRISPGDGVSVPATAARRDPQRAGARWRSGAPSVSTKGRP